VTALLLKKGADINARDKDGRTPLHEAMAYRRYDVARFLVENGADMSLRNKDNETPLISIVYMDNKKAAVDLVNFFIAKGFNISRSADAKLLNESVSRGHHDVAVILLEKGVAFNESSLRDAASMGYEDIFTALLSRGRIPGQGYSQRRRGLGQHRHPEDFAGKGTETDRRGCRPRALQGKSGCRRPSEHGACEIGRPGG
jgi:hypothetical protein